MKLYEADSLRESIKAFTTAIAGNDSCYDCYLRRGFAYKDLKDYGNAFKDFNKLVSIDRKNPEGFANRASLYYLKNDYVNALKDFQSAFQIDTTQTVFYNPISHMLFATGKKDEACELYLKAKSLGDTAFDKSIVDYCEHK